MEEGDPCEHTNRIASGARVSLAPLALALPRVRMTQGPFCHEEKGEEQKYWTTRPSI